MNKSRSRTVNKELLEPLYDYQFRLILIGDRFVNMVYTLTAAADYSFIPILIILFLIVFSHFSKLN